MENALIGYSGFVGATLLKQTSFEKLYRSTNINEIKGKSFDTVVCAGAPAQKWIANREPEEDRNKIVGLMKNLSAISCKTFILISTVDVFNVVDDVNEDSSIDESSLHPYGLHRRMLEKFVAKTFPNHLIVRLPGLVGPGLRKNIIYDLLNSNNVSVIDSRALFQFYPMVNLWYDIQIALTAGLKLVHLTAAPIAVAEVSIKGFGKKFDNALGGEPVIYNMQTRYAQLYGASDSYQYNIQNTLMAIRAYVQSEPVVVKTVAEAKL